VLAGTRLIKRATVRGRSISATAVWIIDRRDQSVLAGFVHPRA
jgi:hypothetical protein